MWIKHKNPQLNIAILSFAIEIFKMDCRCIFIPFFTKISEFNIWRQNSTTQKVSLKLFMSNGSYFNVHMILTDYALIIVWLTLISIIWGATILSHPSLVTDQWVKIENKHAYNVSSMLQQIDVNKNTKNTKNWLSHFQ